MVPVTIKDPSFIVRSEDPWCGGPPLPQLVAAHLTPITRFFVRSHGPVPDIDAATHTVTIDGLVSEPVTFRVSELLSQFSRREAVVTLQCAGNRRDELMAVRPIPGEVLWGAEAVSTARWSGVSLADVLAMVGVAEGAAHVAFEGADDVERLGRVFGFGASISLARALVGDVLIVDRMDGQPLPAEHGGPVRVVVPGYVGARSVKWLNRITLQQEPTDNYFESRAYKVLPADADPATVDWAAYPPIEEAPLHAVICRPVDGVASADGETLVEGYATTGGDRHVTQVEVSADGGDTWTRAVLLDQQTPGAWVRWRASLTLTRGEHELVARATDSAGGTQPEHVRDRWNPKGYMNDAWHRVRVTAG